MASRVAHNFAWFGDCRLIGGKVFVARPNPASRLENEALKEQLRRDAVDPAKAEERRVALAAKQAKRMRNVVVEIRRKRP
ncbi:hypothetical protein ABIF68_006081 [Bradyrhizobium japonicum]|uniref:hypothetical protein n=1 Tax=Bradyrhizobium japonicum TaxID=375 RepID=UPI0004B6E567|nr:hypothetical protein [Bradyrhizobium japonicum]